MWMGEHQGRKVAVKVLRVYSTSNLDEITNVSCHSKLAKSVYRRTDDRRNRADFL